MNRCDFMIGMMIMPRFFVDKPVVDFFEIAGEDAGHIMKQSQLDAKPLSK